MTAHIDDFIRYLWQEQGMAYHTTRAYKADLEDFARWFEQTNGEPLTPEAITPTDVREYRAYLQVTVGAAPTTINRRLASLRRFCRWALERGFIEDDPTKRTKGVETPRTAPKALDRRQVNALVRQAERDTGRFARRNLAIVQLLRHTGMRVGELCSLQLRDIELGERSGKVIIRSGKGSKYREIPLNADVRSVLRDYLEERGQGELTDWLFLGQRGDRLVPSTVYGIIKNYARLAGLEDVTPHTLRHTFAKGLLDAGEDLVTVATLLGHARLDTTARYTQPSERDLHKAVDALASEG